MTTIPPEKKKRPPREPRKGKGNFHKDEFEIFDGRVKIFRTNQSGDVYQMRVWIREQQKYFRVSLRTTSLEESIQKSEEIFLDLRSKLRNNEPIFDFTPKELVEKYLEHKKNDVTTNFITQERWVTIRSQMKHYLFFVKQNFGENVKINSINHSLFQEYILFRKTYHQNVKNLTLKNEIGTIRNFYKFGHENKLISQTTYPLFTKIPKKDDDKICRDPFSLNEWRVLYNYLKKWNTKEDTKENQEKQFIRDFIIILCNTGIRFGEGRKLRWSNIHILPNEQKNKTDDVMIEVTEGKTGRRTVVGRRGDVFTRLKQLSKHTKPNDFVFVDNGTGNQIVKDTYYKYWNMIMKETGLDKSYKNLVYYSLRHTYTTFRLYSGVDVFTLSRNLGCSVQFIEKHYGHVEVMKKHSELVKDMTKEEKSILMYD
jgi:integrase